MQVWIGTHQVNWLWDGQADFGLCVALPRLEFKGARAQPAVVPYVLDSGAYSMLAANGQWLWPAEVYVSRVRHWCKKLGTPHWCAPQDWMCEPDMVVRTGLSVEEHQRRTVANYLELRSSLHGLVIPVLQGYTLADYARCAEMYQTAGVKLEHERVVGVGSVCRRQATSEIAEIFRWAASEKIAAHGFGVKTLGIERYGRYLHSCDSMAWCLDASRAEPLEGCTHKRCNNCPKYARQWRAKLVERANA